MSALENMKTRLEFNGGTQQRDRLDESKLKSLKKALNYSYQAATAILEDEREFKCLINPDKLKNNYDDKIISIPFEDVCLNSKQLGKTSEGIVEIGMKAGDTFTWKENGSKWLVFLRRYEETAYFRAEIRKCEYVVTIGEKDYPVYLRGPEQTTIDWKKGNNEMYNKENYSILMYITKNDETEEYFHRFTTIKLNNKPWEVQAVDRIATEGILEVILKEDFSNTIQEEINKEINEAKEIIPEVHQEVYIDGADIVFPYGEETYTIVGASNGTWEISNNKAIIVSSTSAAADIEIVTGRSGDFILKYKRENEEDIELSITIESL